MELIELDRRIASYDRRIRELYPQQRAVPAPWQNRRHRTCDSNSADCRRRGSELLQEWPSVRCVAGAGPEAAVEWGTNPIVRHQQTRRSLFAHVDDPWRARCARESRRQTGSAKPLARQACANGAIRTSRRLHSPTRMRVSSGPCSPATNFTNPHYRYRRPRGEAVNERISKEVSPGNCNKW